MTYMQFIQKIIGTCVVSLTLVGPFSLNAATSASDIADLTAQLQALTEYVDRISTSARAPLSESQMRSVVLNGTEWLLDSQEASGHFAYEYAPFEGKYLDDDNIVRQGGALFALGEVYRRQDKKDARLAAGIERAAGFFESISIDGEGNGKEFRCVANSENSSTCKLGATALVLLGLLGYVEGNPDAEREYRTLIRDYTEYILATQKKSGGFVYTYRASGFSNDESPFSNGEALLALVRAYQYEPGTELKNAIDTAFDYLKVQPYVNPLYLWITAALKDMQQLWPNDEYVSYTRDFTNWRLRYATYERKDRNYCPYIEGVTSAYSVLATAPLQGELQKIRSEMDKWNAYHRTLQLRASEMYRVTPTVSGGVKISAVKDVDQAAGGFLTSHSIPTQRIDFTQHCVSAYVQTLVDIDKQAL